MADSPSPDLVELPRFSGAEAVSVLEELLAVADAQKAPLPDPIHRSASRLRVAHAALVAALRGDPRSGAPSTFAATARPGSSDEPTSPRRVPTATPLHRREADALDAAWEATFAWLSGWCKLPEAAHPHRAAAHALFALLFADALRTGGLAYKIELAQSHELLQAIARERQEATFAALGGSAFLDHLRRAHEALSALVSQDAGVDFRAELAAAVGALRAYAVRVASHADGEVAGSEALAATLLEPLDRFHALNPTRARAEPFDDVEDPLP